MIDPLFIMTARWFLALLLLVAGIHKAVNRSQFHASLAAYRIVPTQLARFTANMLTAGETIVGASLLILPAQGQMQKWANLAAGLILGVYFSAMAFNIGRGRTNLDCGCTLLHARAPLSGWHLLRGLFLIGLAVLMWLPMTERPLHWLDGAQVTAAVICLGVLYLSADGLLANRAHLPQAKT